MGLQGDLEKLVSRVEAYKDIIQSEESTKQALILPFIKLLGYDVDSPLEVVPEYVCDFGTKKGEKVDYCIRKGTSEHILIECKDCRCSLTQHNISQLYRYFSVSSAKIAILTNGIDYMLFTDSVEKNKMDIEPFYRFNMLSISSEDAHIIEMLTKEHMNDTSIASFSKISLFRTEVKKWIAAEASGLSRDFVLFIKRKLNTYSLPNEDISRIVSEMLFPQNKVVLGSSPVTSSQDKQDTECESATKSVKKARPLGMTGIFGLDTENLRQDIAGSTLCFTNICGKEYEGTAIYCVLFALIDYALDELHLSVKEIAAIDDEASDLLRDVAHSSDKHGSREHRGIFFYDTLSAASVIKAAVEIAELLKIPLCDVKLGLLSSDTVVSLRQDKVPRSEFSSFLKSST